MKRIVLATSGSFGDLHPYIAVALALQARGHAVTIATSEAHREKVEGEGLAFHPVRPELTPSTHSPEMFARINDPRSGPGYLLNELVLPYVDQMYEDLLEGCRRADLLVIHPVLFAAPLVAEKLNLPWVSVILAPGAFVSAYDPPVFPPFPWLYPLRHLGPLPSYLVFEFCRKATRKWAKSLDELRRREGLRPAQAHPLHAELWSPYGTLAWFSPLLAAPQPDWPRHTNITGFVFYDKQHPGEGLNHALRDFLCDGDPPLVFTLGTSAVLAAGNFYQESLRAIEQLNKRAVLLTGAQGRNPLPGNLPKSIFVADYAPYSELFPHAAAIVHSGGIGTCAHVLRAGVPMLVVPFAFDQPDNAARMQRLGVARVLSAKRYNANRAAEILAKLIQDSHYATRCRSIAAQIKNEDGIANACRALETVLQSNPKREAEVDLMSLAKV
ncbi:MAG: glycosyltransferase family 1 protein [Acidobacteriaceae bacterium]|nr:glycosyltransferase family 1 protein [Acidobacteriaceae bacterium]